MNRGNISRVCRIDDDQSGASDIRVEGRNALNVPVLVQIIDTYTDYRLFGNSQGA